MDRAMHRLLIATLMTTTISSISVAGDEKSLALVDTTSAIGPDLSADAIETATFAAWQDRVRTVPERPDDDMVAGDEAAIDARGKPSDAEPTRNGDSDQAPDPFLIRIQVLLDRAHASPGVIDGLDGGNTAKAIKAYEQMRELDGDGVPDQDFWDVLAVDQGKAMKEYEITQADLDARYVPDMPQDYAELAKLEWLGYRDPVEMLAERFHMDEHLLRLLNPTADFGKVGEKLLVTDVGSEPETKVARIVVDKERGELFAYDAEEKLVLALPATIGSSSTPSPEGTMNVNGSAQDPTYEYDPDKNFQQGENSEELTIPAGPNGPVGNIWIDLSEPTYGIYGTPEPSEIDKTASHGCVRLTNWDAQALSKLVLPAETVVEFQ